MIDGKQITGILFWYRSARIPLTTVTRQAKTYGGAVMACALAAENPRLLILVQVSALVKRALINMTYMVGRLKDRPYVGVTSSKWINVSTHT